MQNVRIALLYPFMWCEYNCFMINESNEAHFAYQYPFETAKKFMPSTAHNWQKNIKKVHSLHIPAIKFIGIKK